MSKSLIIPDVHLGAGLNIGKQGIGSTLNSRVVDQLNLLDWIFDRANEFAVKDIIMAGDIFQDAKPHPTYVSLFISWLKKCADHNMNMHIIAGNHDIMRSGQFHMSALDIVAAADLDNVSVYKHSTTIHTNGASYTLLPFRDRRFFNIDSNVEAVKILVDSIKYELAEIEDNQYKVVVGHLAIEGSIPIGDEIDDMINELFCPLSMFNGYDYTWMGHIHKPQVMSKSPYIAHIGSMDISDFGETEQTKVIVIFDPDKETPYKYLELPTRPLKSISISVPHTVVDTTNFVVKTIQASEKLDRAIVKLNITLDSPNLPPIDRTIVEQSIINMGAFHIARINEEKKVSLVKKDQNENIDNTVNEATAIKMYANSNIDDLQKEQFIHTANEIVKEYFAELK